MEQCGRADKLLSGVSTSMRCQATTYFRVKLLIEWQLFFTILGVSKLLNNQRRILQDESKEMLHFYLNFHISLASTFCTNVQQHEAWEHVRAIVFANFRYVHVGLLLEPFISISSTFVCSRCYFIYVKRHVPSSRWMKKMLGRLFDMKSKKKTFAYNCWLALKNV